MEAILAFMALATRLITISVADGGYIVNPWQHSAQTPTLISYLHQGQCEQKIFLPQDQNGGYVETKEGCNFYFKFPLMVKLSEETTHTYLNEKFNVEKFLKKVKEIKNERDRRIKEVFRKKGKSMLMVEELP